MAKNKSFSVQNSITFGNIKKTELQESDNSFEAVKNEINHVEDDNDSSSSGYENESSLQETAVPQEEVSPMKQENILNRDSEPHDSDSEPFDNGSEILDNDSRLPDNNFEVHNNQDDNYPKDVLKEKVKLYMKEPIKKTSITIQRSSLNYLAYSSKIEGLTQPEYLTMLLLEEMDKPVTQPDFNIVVEKRSTIGTITKGIQLPESICNWTKKRSALEMKNMSEYMDDLLQSHMRQSIHN